MSVTTDYPDYSPHVAAATQIAATGVPLLTLSSVITGPGTFTLTGGASKTYTVSNIGQIAYEALVTASIPSAATVPFLQVSLAWRDSVTNALMWSDTFIAACATSPAFWVTRGRGQSKADQLIVTVTNLDPAQTATFNLTVFQNSRVPPSDTWQWDNISNSGSTIPGFTLATLVADESVLGIINAASIAASGSSQFLCGMAPGRLVQIAGEITGPTASSITVTVQVQPSSVYTGAHFLLRQTLTTQNVNYTFVAPRGPVQVNIANAATTGPATANLMLTAQD